VKLPITSRNIPYAKVLKDTVLRGFTGGWNTLDDELNLSYKYSLVLRNCYSAQDGKIVVREGVTKFSNVNGEDVINVEYFIDSLVIVTAPGNVYRMFGNGAFLELTTTLWSNTEFTSFAKFNNQLILCNGVDKPLIIDDNFTIDYLKDLATLTNINVPICKYVLSISRYLVMAGDPLEPNRVHISARDAPGTWYGDPPPNDATRVDVGSVLPSASTIRGLLAFRGKLVVTFLEGLVFGTLGNYDADGNHDPDFSDGVEGFGSVSHRAGVTYGDDALFLDLEGVPSIRRTVLSTSFKPERISSLIDTEIRTSMSSLDFGTLEDRVFSVHMKKTSQFMLFVPNTSDRSTTTETRAFVYSRLGDNAEAWSEYLGWNFTCGTRSLQGEIFFGDKDGNIWLHSGNTDYADSTVSPIVEGTGIDFDWTMPWLDFANRAVTKTNKYIAFDTKGASEFTCEMYVDQFTEPTLSMDFSGGDQGQFGDGPQPYGGGRNTSRKRKYAWPAKFEIAKLRFSGTSSEGLEFVSITFYYQLGGINL
jgi:hypothetical protein